MYLAERADGQYQQRVALKLIKRGMDTEQVLARFRAERQILASLDHPNIARLLDGGSTDAGPAVLRDGVHRRRADRHLRRAARELSVEDRLRLFLQVCGAVAYAHQHLVIHRDIKPLNILVTADGDAEAARLRHREGAARRTATSHLDGHRDAAADSRIRQPRAGRGPTRHDGERRLRARRGALRAADRPLPLSHCGAARRRRWSKRCAPPIRIVRARQATTRSCAGGSGAISTPSCSPRSARSPTAGTSRSSSSPPTCGRHLDGMPVLARPDTFGYRAGKFVRRNRVPVAAGALVVLALVGGTIATAYQARQARAAQARAERRFADVRKLAHTVLFDYHDAIKDLRGARPVRERLVHDALGYLDGLAREVEDDPSLQRELAAAYRRVGDLQASDPSGGDTEGATRSYAKALAISETLLRADSAPQARRDVASGALALGCSGLGAGESHGGARPRAARARLARATRRRRSARYRSSAAAQHRDRPVGPDLAGAGGDCPRPGVPSG